MAGGHCPQFICGSHCVNFARKCRRGSRISAISGIFISIKKIQRMKRATALLFAALLLVSVSAQQYPFLDTGLSFEKRVDDLVSRMTTGRKPRSFFILLLQFPAWAFRNTTGGMRHFTGLPERVTLLSFRSRLLLRTVGMKS